MNDSSHCFHFGPYKVDLRTQEIWRDGQKVKLAGQPFAVLEMLLTCPGKLVPRDELQKRLWPEDRFIDATHGLNAAIAKLRDALQDSADNPQYIETLPRRGYRFIGQLENLDSASLSTVSHPVDTVVVHEQGMLQALAPHAWNLNPTLSRRPSLSLLVTVAAALILGTATGIELSKGMRWINGASRRAQDAAQARELEAKESQETKARIAETAVPQSSPVKEEVLAARRELVAANCAVPEKQPALRTADFRTIISGEGGNAAPQFSPDGKRIAFMSDRSGPWQIWMSNVDGSDPKQVSFTDSAGTPRWSPDGSSIAFDAPFEGMTYVFVLRVDRAADARPLIEGRVPSFSRDGKWIYYASDRSGQSEVWKVPVDGGAEKRMTSRGGFAALESPDGNIYYSKSGYGSPEIWKVPADGGPESAVLPVVRPRTWSSWTVTKEGILFATDSPDGGTHLNLFDSNRQIRDLAPLQSAPHWMAATSDGKRVVMNDAAERQITMLDGLR